MFYIFEKLSFTLKEVNMSFFLKIKSFIIIKIFMIMYLQILDINITICDKLQQQTGELIFV